MTLNKALVVSSLVLLVILGWLLVRSNENPKPLVAENNTTSTEARDIEQNADFDNKPTLLIGSPDAKVRLIEYIDFKCPNCNKFHQDAGKRVRDEYVASGKVAIEIRNFPFIGPDSGRAARGTYCAHDQNAFAAYHDAVFNYIWDKHYKNGNLKVEIEDVLTSDVLTALVADKLQDSVAFNQCINADTKNSFIDADLLLGADDGINGTPGFIIGGQKITGPANFTTFQTLLDIQLR